jgi:hypothetical protein
VLTSTPGGTQAIGRASVMSRSSLVKTATTPSRSLAAEVSIETIFAWASGERTHAAQSWPVRLMSST